MKRKILRRLKVEGGGKEVSTIMNRRQEMLRIEGRQMAEKFWRAGGKKESTKREKWGRRLLSRLVPGDVVFIDQAVEVASGHAGGPGTPGDISSVGGEDMPEVFLLELLADLLEGLVELNH